MVQRRPSCSMTCPARIRFACCFIGMLFFGLGSGWASKPGGRQRQVPRNRFLLSRARPALGGMFAAIPLPHSRWSGPWSNRDADSIELEVAGVKLGYANVREVDGPRAV